jgi:hypothetical protein
MYERSRRYCIPVVGIHNAASNICLAGTGSTRPVVVDIFFRKMALDPVPVNIRNF